MDMKLIDKQKIDIKPWCIKLKIAAEMSQNLKNLIDENGKIDLSESYAINEYNKAAFKIMANITIEIPDGNLIPTACLRQAYLTILSENLFNNGDKIIEIGTGSSAAISLLAAKNYNLEVIATEIDEVSLMWAKKNIAANKMGDKINLVKSDGGIIKPIVKNNISINDYNTVLCYPPTYPESDREYFRNNRTKKGFKGTQNEMIGGGKDGYDFIERYIDESIFYDIENITILLIFELHKEMARNQLIENNRNVKIIELVAGNRIRYLMVGSKK